MKFSRRASVKMGTPCCRFAMESSAVQEVRTGCTKVLEGVSQVWRAFSIGLEKNVALVAGKQFRRSESRRKL